MVTAKIIAAAVVIVAGFLFAQFVWWFAKLFAKAMTYFIPLLTGVVIYVMIPENAETKDVVIYAAAGVVISALLSAGYMITANIFDIEKRLEKLERIKVTRSKRPPMRKQRRPVIAQQPREPEVVEPEVVEPEVVEPEVVEPEVVEAESVEEEEERDV